MDPTNCPVHGIGIDAVMYFYSSQQSRSIHRYFLKELDITKRGRVVIGLPQSLISELIR